MTESGGTSGRARLTSLRKRRRRVRVLRWLVLLAVLAAGVLLWLRYPSLRAPSEPDGAAAPAGVPDATPPGPAEPPETRTPPAAPAAGPTAPAPAAPLPSLEESDAVLRQEAGALSDAPAWSRWLASADLLERFVLAVVQVSEGASPRKPLADLAPAAPYRVVAGADGRLTPHPASYGRYDDVARVIGALDAEACAALYRRFEPLVDEAHAQLGAPDTPLRDVLARAAAEILLAPRVVGEPELVFHVNHYRYVDPRLESLSSAQKLILRTGPDNARRIRTKVREIARALGIPERSLPETPVYRVADP